MRDYILTRGNENIDINIRQYNFICPSLGRRKCTKFYLVIQLFYRSVASFLSLKIIETLIKSKRLFDGYIIIQRWLQMLLTEMHFMHFMEILNKILRAYVVGQELFHSFASMKLMRTRLLIFAREIFYALLIKLE